MRNACLESAMAELENAGIRDVQQVRGGGHLQLRWKIDGHGLRIYTLPLTPSDWRSPMNVRSEVRRMLRNDGVLTTPERSEPPPKPAPKLDRVAVLEQKVRELEEFVRTIRTIGGQHGSQ